MRLLLLAAHMWDHAGSGVMKIQCEHKLNFAVFEVCTTGFYQIRDQNVLTREDCLKSDFTSAALLFSEQRCAV